jgi:Porin subfamily
VLGGNTSDADRAKVRFPDIVQNWRVDQAWGSAQLMVAAHDASAGYYAANNAAPFGSACAIGANQVGVLTGSETCGHPADKLGWAVGGGARLNAYGGDYFQFQANYTQGAARYVALRAGPFSAVQFNGGNLGYGFFSDGVFSNATGDIQLTTVWGINAAYDHLWLPNFRTSIYGSYIANRYNDAANTAICSAQLNAAGGAIQFAGGASTGPAAFPGTSNVAVCNNNFNWWQIGSRTQYNFTPWFYVGFDVIYQKLETASRDAVVTYTAATNTAKPTAIYTVQDQDNYGLLIRVHRDIVP